MNLDYVMCELQKMSLEVVTSMQEVEVTRNQERSKLYISDTLFYLDASSIIPASVHSENSDFRWITKLKIQADAPILEKLNKKL